MNFSSERIIFLTACLSLVAWIFHPAVQNQNDTGTNTMQTMAMNMLASNQGLSPDGYFFLASPSFVDTNPINKTLPSMKKSAMYLQSKYGGRSHVLDERSINFLSFSDRNRSSLSSIECLARFDFDLPILRRVVDDDDIRAKMINVIMIIIIIIIFLHFIFSPTKV